MDGWMDGWMQNLLFIKPMSHTHELDLRVKLRPLFFVNS